ncbi:MAG: DUF6754 domain-containing protein [Anaerolineae bacterium]
MSGFGESLIAHSGTATLVVLALFISFFTLFTLRARAGLRIPLRPIRPVERLRALAERSTETGAPIVTWLAGGLQDVAGPESVAGLTLYDFVSRQAARADQPAPLSTSNPVALLLAMNILQANRERHQFHESFRGREVQFYGQPPVVYASGVTMDPSPDPRTATLIAGPFESEGLWLGESNPVPNTLAVVAAGDPAGNALITVSYDTGPSEEARRLMDDPLLPGEDMYSAGAYLHRPAALGSLLAEDWARALIIALVLIAVLLTSLGYGG